MVCYTELSAKDIYFVPEVLDADQPHLFKFYWTNFCVAFGKGLFKSDYDTYGEHYNLYPQLLYGFKYSKPMIRTSWESTYS